mgnify:FL=1
MPSSRKTSGFTYIEIVAVLLVLGVLAAVVVGASRLGVTARAEADLLAVHLRYAQARAMGDTVPWGVQIAGASYSLRRDGAPAPVSLPGEPSATRSFASGVSATPLTVTFGPTRGVPLDGEGHPLAESQIIRVSGDSTVTVTVTRVTGFIP